MNNSSLLARIKSYPWFYVAYFFCIFCFVGFVVDPELRLVASVYEFHWWEWQNIVGFLLFSFWFLWPIVFRNPLLRLISCAAVIFVLIWLMESDFRTWFGLGGAGGGGEGLVFFPFVYVGYIILEYGRAHLVGRFIMGIIALIVACLVALNIFYEIRDHKLFPVDTARGGIEKLRDK